MAVRPGHRRGQNVAHLQISGNLRVAHQQITGLAVLSHHGDRHGPISLYRTRHKRLITGAVEDRTRIVAHPTVDRHIGANPVDPLDRAHRVERDRSRRHD